MTSTVEEAVDREVTAGRLNAARITAFKAGTRAFLAAATAAYRFFPHLLEEGRIDRGSGVLERCVCLLTARRKSGNVASDCTAARLYP